MKNSAAYSFLNEQLEKEFARLDKEKLTPWIFMATNHGLDVTTVDGRKIMYEGRIEFSDTPRQVFWECFSVPFLKDIISRSFANAREFCRDNGLDSAIPLDETATLLRQGIDKTFSRMVYIDMCLRGKGIPASVQPYDPRDEVAKTLAFLNERLEAEKLLLPKKRNRLNQFYEEQKFWIWAIGSLITILVSIIKFIG